MTVAGGQDGIDVAAFLGHLDDGVEAVGEVSSVAAFAGVAATEAGGYDVALLVIKRSGDFVQNEAVLDVFDTMDNLAGAAETEDGGEMLGTGL